MKKILFPFKTDNTAYKEAYVYAVKFARNLNTELILLNAFNIDYNNSITRKDYNQKVKTGWLNAYDEAAVFQKYYLKNYARMEDELRIKIDYRFLHSTLKKEIRNALDNEEIELVILPLSNDIEFNSKQFDIIHDNIFEKNFASLLVIPKDVPYRKVENIVFAINLKKLNHFNLYINDILRYAKVFNANIHFLHVTASNESTLPGDLEAYRTIMQIIKHNKNFVFKSIYSEDVPDAVNEYVEKKECDMLSVVRHHHYFLDTILHRSISDKVSLNSKVPVLVMREKMN